MKTYFLTPIDKKLFQINLAIIALFCLALATYAWSPGMVIVDTMAQYLQAIGKLPCSDWFSPLETRLWQLQIFVFRTSNLMVFSLSFLIALALWILIQLRPCRLGYVLYLFIFFSTPFFGYLSVLRSDLFLSVLVLLAVSFILLSEESLSFKNAKFLKYLAIFLLVLAVFMRANAAFICVPLLVYLLFGWKFNLKSLFISLCGVLFFIVATGIVNHKILGAENSHAEISLELFDIGGIAYFTTPSLNEEMIFSDWDKETENHQLAACYTPQQWDTYAPWGYDKKTGIWNQSDDKIINERIARCRDLGNGFRKSLPDLKHKWITSIKMHPIAYIEHRSAHFFNFMLGKNTLGLVAPWTDPGYYPLDHQTLEMLVPDRDAIIEDYYRPDRNLLKTHKNAIEFKYRDFFGKLNNAFWNKGGFWFGIAFLICAFSWRSASKRQCLINCFSFSALMYLFGYFFVGISYEFRYFLPSIYLLYVTILFIFFLNQKRLKI